MQIKSLSEVIENAFNIDFNTFIAVSFSTAIVALLIVFVIRWLGNKGMGQLSTIEMIIILGLGEAVGQSMVNPNQTSIPQGFTVVIIAIAIFKIYDYLASRFNKFSKTIVSDPILLVKDGKIIDESMKKAKISKKELESYMRLSGTDDISDIKSSHLEINGQVSFVKK
ncbi:MAG TPA: YetF domain-containing protein [Nitrososphaeraceae archaeon]|nr:YetF domain-containing protein [Nitrososphaeraceae archaeon]